MAMSPTESYQRSPVTRDRIRIKSIFSVIVFVIATILTPVAVAGHWAHSTVLDAERYIETVGPIGDSPEVQEALAEVVTDAILERIDTEEIVSEFLGGILPGGGVLGDALAGPIASGINSLIGNAVTAIITSDAFSKAWITLNTAAQKGLVAVLSGDPSGPIEIQGDNLVLNLDPLLELAQQKLVEQGISFAENVSIPATDAQFTLMSVPALDQARTVYSFSAPALNWVVVFIALLFIISILLARRRARTSVAAGIAVMVNAVLIYALVTTGEEVFTNQFEGSIFEGASIVVYQNFLAYLVAGLWALFGLGIIIVIGGWLSGHTHSAQYIRGQFTNGLFEIAERTGLHTGEKLGPYAPWIRWAVIIVWLVPLLSGTYLGSLSGLWYTLLIAGVWTVLEILIRAGVQPTRQEVLVVQVEEIVVLDQA